MEIPDHEISFWSWRTNSDVTVGAPGRTASSGMPLRVRRTGEAGRKAVRAGDEITFRRSCVRSLRALSKHPATQRSIYNFHLHFEWRTIDSTEFMMPFRTLSSRGARIIDSGIVDPTGTSRYVQGEYLQKNPSWHVEDSPWKAAQILRAFALLSQPPRTICEIGCGAGEILRQLELLMPSTSTTQFVGYDISPQAIELARPRESLRTKFVLGDAKSVDRHFEALLCIDVFEHIEDYFSFLREIRQKADYFVFHIPLELNCEGLLRNFPMVTRGLYGHLHQFSRETALAVLNDCGYTVVGDFYTPGYECMPDNLHTKVTKNIRRMIFTALPRLSVRLISGLSLMVVAKG